MNFDDIIDLPHFHADGRPYMSMRDRAAQFMPFKNLKGFDELVDEEEFDIEIDADNAESIVTVADAIEQIKNAIS